MSSATSDSSDSRHIHGFTYSLFRRFDSRLVTNRDYPNIQFLLQPGLTGRVAGNDTAVTSEMRQEVIIGPDDMGLLPTEQEVHGMMEWLAASLPPSEDLLGSALASFADIPSVDQTEAVNKYLTIVAEREIPRGFYMRTTWCPGAPPVTVQHGWNMITNRELAGSTPVVTYIPSSVYKANTIFTSDHAPSHLWMGTTDFGIVVRLTLYKDSRYFAHGWRIGLAFTSPQETAWSGRLRVMTESYKDWVEVGLKRLQKKHSLISEQLQTLNRKASARHIGFQCAGVA